MVEGRRVTLALNRLSEAPSSIPRRALTIPKLRSPSSGSTPAHPVEELVEPLQRQGCPMVGHVRAEAPVPTRDV